MWIKAILVSGLIAAAAVPLLIPAATSAPQPVLVSAKPAAGDTVFTAICRDGVLPEKRPDADWVRTGYNNDGCRLAPVPAALDGTTATREAIVAAMAEAKRYEAAADAFRQCVGDYVAAHNLTQAQRLIQDHRLLVGQKSKDMAVAQVRTAIEAFNMYGIDCSG